MVLSDSVRTIIYFPKFYLQQIEPCRIFCADRTLKFRKLQIEPWEKFFLLQIELCGQFKRQSLCEFDDELRIGFINIFS